VITWCNASIVNNLTLVASAVHILVVMETANAKTWTNLLDTGSASVAGLSAKRLLNSIRALTLIPLLAPLMALGSTHAPQPAVDLGSLFTQAAASTGIDVKLLRAVCWVESNHRIKVRRIYDQDNANRKGAPSYGICQLQLATAKDHGYMGSAKDLLKPHNNILMAAKYLKWLLSKAKGDWKLAATGYNRGWKGAKKARRYNSYVIRVLFAMKEGR
jgi:soluble lytic murein transglycosylase-like protein